MKLRLFLLLLVSGMQVFAQVGNSRESKNHLKDMNLYGKVKTFKITPYKLVDYFGKVTKGDKQDFWRGDVCAENSKNKHKFKSESLDPNQGEGDDDDDVDFEATTEEALRRSQARSFNPRSTFRSMPRDYKNGVRRIRI